MCSCSKDVHELKNMIAQLDKKAVEILLLLKEPTTSHLPPPADTCEELQALAECSALVNKYTSDLELHDN